MEIKGKVHCFFEQSGTFKNEFIKLGIPSEDYDIQNNFGETENVVDLFKEIENAWGGGKSIFDKINSNDLIIAFFPCIYFCENNQLYFIGEHMNLRKLPTKERAEIIITRAKKRGYFYELALKFCALCEERGLKLILENPYSAQHYLVGNFPYKAKLIDRNRTLRGDFFKKPTQYFFINCEPTIGYSYSKNKEQKQISKSKGSKNGLCSEERSLISPDYARNFICDFILGKQQKNTLITLF